MRRIRPNERSFARQSVLKRAIVLTAGSLMNLAIPIVIFAVVAALPQDVPVGTVTVTRRRARIARGPGGHPTR